MSSEVVRSLAKNTSVMMMSQVITWISSLILLLSLPRYLGTESYGQLFLAISLAMIAQVVIEFGGPFLVAKEISRSSGNPSSLLANSLLLRAVLWVLCTVAIVGVSYAAGYPSRTRLLIFILVVSKLWEGAGRVLASCYQGFEMMQYPSLGAIIERVTAAAFGVAALLLGAGAVTIACVMAMSTLLNALTQAFFIRRIITTPLEITWNHMKYLLTAGVPYVFWSIFAIVYYRIDAVMLSIMTPPRVVGWYGAAYRLFDVLMFLPSIYVTALFPVLSKSWGKDSLLHARTMQKSLDYILFAGIPISVCVYFFAKQIIGLLFGLPAYEPSIILLQVFAVGLLLVYIDFILISTIVASDRTTKWTLAAFTAMLLNMLLNYILIPYCQQRLGNGGIGAAIATLVTEFAVMCCALYLVPESLLRQRRVEVQLKGLGCGALMISLMQVFVALNVEFIAAA
ncbi:MAG TPA: flippase, partial [Bacteroidota bacterium]|nr:flippase [Bacteroidota bacterium]